MAEDSGRLREECAPAHTGRGRRLSATSYRVAKRSPDRSSARRPYLQMPQWHPRVAKSASIGTLARGPSTEALLGQGRVSKERKSVPLTGLWSGSRPGLARPPTTEALLGQGRVPKERTSVPLQGLWSSSRPGLARHPRLQVVLRHPRVAKRSPDRSLARRPYLQMPQWHPRVAKGVF